MSTYKVGNDEFKLIYSLNIGENCDTVCFYATEELAEAHIEKYHLKDASICPFAVASWRTEVHIHSKLSYPILTEVQ